MTRDPAKRAGLLKEKLAVLETLAGALHTAKESIVANDHPKLEENTLLRASLCLKWKKLDAELAALPVSIEKSQESQASMESLKGALLHVCDLIRRRNQELQSLQARSTRTIQVLLNAWRSFDGQYAQASAQTFSAPAKFQERA